MKRAATKPNCWPGRLAPLQPCVSQVQIICFPPLTIPAFWQLLVEALKYPHCRITLVWSSTERKKKKKIRPKHQRGTLGRLFTVTDAGNILFNFAAISILVAVFEVTTILEEGIVGEDLFRRSTIGRVMRITHMTVDGSSCKRITK